MEYVLFLLGLILLCAGAQLLINGATRLGQLAGISPLVIGLTVVAYGTSTPELVVSTMSAATGQSGIALGNVVGSNIFNVLFILGVSALVAPLVVNQRLLQIDTPLVFLLSLVTYFLCWNSVIHVWEGTFLFVLLLAYTVLAIIESRKETEAIQQEYAREYGLTPDEEPNSGVFLSVSLTLLGLVLLIAGSRLFTLYASQIARNFGLSELVIGLTIVAAGTSMPEVATSVLAVSRGETDIAVGNVIGSNLFNIAGVLGLSSIVSGTGIPVSPAVLEFDLPVKILVSILCLPIFFTEHRISRWEGGIFLVYYVLYTLNLLTPQLHPFASRSVNYLLYFFILPLTFLTLGIGLYRYLSGKTDPSSYDP